MNACGERVDLDADAVTNLCEPVDINGVRVSLHPAGHVLGSAQVRIEHRGEVWVVSGDYKLQPDPTCEAFEPVVCDTFVSESTFGLPIYRWAPPSQVFAEIDAWWAANATAGRASVLYCYSFGKAQRILASVDASIGPIVCHGAIESLNRVYRAAGVTLPDTALLSDATRAEPDRQALSSALVLAPPSAAGTSSVSRVRAMASDCVSRSTSGNVDTSVPHGYT